MNLLWSLAAVLSLLESFNRSLLIWMRGNDDICLVIIPLRRCCHLLHIFMKNICGVLSDLLQVFLLLPLALYICHCLFVICSALLSSSCIWCRLYISDRDLGCVLLDGLTLGSTATLYTLVSFFSDLIYLLTCRGSCHYTDSCRNLHHDENYHRHDSKYDCECQAAI